MTHHLPSKLAAALALSVLAPLAHASCGSAFCSLMTDRYAQGSGEAHLGWSADLRLESVTQKQLRSGTTNLDASQVTGEEAIERHSKNLNLVTSLSYGLDRDWSVSVRIPVVKRDHLHDLIDEQTGLASTPEQWRFTKLGDLQVLARRQLTADGGGASYAVFGGLKLPTGSVNVTNGDGVRAERALQPGSGTTDAVIGGAARFAIGLTDAVIGQASLTRALNKREEFKPGQRIEVSAGWSHAYSQGAVVWVIISELLPNAVRASGNAAVCVLVWLLCLGVSQSFPVVAGETGQYASYAFGFFAVMMVLQFFMVLRYLPETKGLSLEELQKRMGVED